MHRASGGKRPEGVPSGWELPASSEQQEIILQAIRWYGRRKLRKEIDAVHRRLVIERPAGRLVRQIRRIFPEA
ncbi:MAG: hypothetical protein H6566_04500 [Lewinellaceae bacterium]|nr:hypothetical protein [Lewinellaceae bacterium]